MSTYALLDVDNLSHRNWYAMRETPQLKRVGFGLLRDVYNLSQVLNTTDFLFCYDQGDSIRKRIHPEYKSNHDHDAESYKIIKTQLEETKSLLHAIGFSNVYSKQGYEADDLLAFLCQDRHPENGYIIVSTDQDLYQLLNRGVTIWNPITKSMITEQRFIGKYGIRPCNWIEYKALAGCKGDNIKGIVGETSALNYIRGSLSADSSYFKKIELQKEKGMYKKNLELVKLPCSLLKDPKLEIHNSHVSNKHWQEVLSKMDYDYLADRSPFPSVVNG